MPRWLYSLLLRLGLPFASLAFAWRGWRHAAYRGSLRERLGLLLPVRNDRPLWLHAASVGEVQALLPLLQPLRSQQVPLLVTVGTPTGVNHARRLLDEGIAVQAAPWDLPGATARFLRAVRPRAGVLVEGELWPNLVAAANRAQVPLVLVSGRMSERSLHRYLRLAPALMRATVRGFRQIGVQDAASAARFVALGAAAAQVTVTGNLKFDLALPDGIGVAGQARRAHAAPTRPMWVAGSTHPGEEEVLLEAQRRLVAGARAAHRPVPLLVMAPRRPERFDAAWRWLQAQRVTAARTSEADSADQEVEVLLLDQMGVLPEWYAACDAAYVGGSLVPVGGHNVLEPAALGRFVLVGPCPQNAPQALELLREAGGLAVVADATAIAAVLEPLLQDRERAVVTGGLAAAAVRENQGAARRALELIRMEAGIPAA